MKGAQLGAKVKGTPRPGPARTCLGPKRRMDSKIPQRTAGFRGFEILPPSHETIVARGKNIRMTYSSLFKLQNILPLSRNVLWVQVLYITMSHRLTPKRLGR